MRRTWISLAVFGIALCVPAVSKAIEAKHFNCEKAVVTELAKFSRARGKCITTCVGKKQTKPSLNKCSPSFDPNTAACAQKAVDNYSKAIVSKCTGNMPACGGYLKGFCRENTSLTCNRGTECAISLHCDGRCSTTTSTTCKEDVDCPSGETCVSDTATKDVATFAAGNLFEGDPVPPTAQIDSFAETLFQCRQAVCSGNGDLCGDDGDCTSPEVCTPGKCSDGTPCRYDGNCGTGTTKKCLPLGRCSLAPQACVTSQDCGANGACQRWGRCVNAAMPTSSSLDICYDNTMCTAVGETCGRTPVDTDRKKEQACTKAVGDALAKVTFDVANCQAGCALERDLKLGQRCDNDPSKKCQRLDDCPGGTCRPTSCDPLATGRCANDLSQVCAGDADCARVGGVCTDTTPDPISRSLKDCRDKAFAKGVASINKKCATLPTCGAYSPFGGTIGNFNRPEDLMGFVNGLQDKQFKEDNPDLGAGSNFCEQ
jgi:hypothetical protein